MNSEAEDVTVTTNGTYSVTVSAGSSEAIIESLPQPKPPLPWTVVITTVTGAEIGTEYYTGPVDQRLTVSSGRLTTEPYDIREDDC